MTKKSKRIEAKKPRPAKTPGVGVLRVTGLKTHQSAGYKVLGTTRDGVKIVRPKGHPKSFGLRKLGRALRLG